MSDDGTFEYDPDIDPVKTYERKVTPDLEFFCVTPGVKLKILGEPGDPITQAPPYWFGPKGRSGAMPIPPTQAARASEM